MMLFSIIIFWTFIYSLIPYFFICTLVLLNILVDRVQRKIQNVQSSLSSGEPKIQKEQQQQQQQDDDDDGCGTKQSEEHSSVKSSKRLFALNAIRWSLYCWTRFVSKLMELYGQLMHSYEVVGLEHIPKDGPALLICYHGTLPEDMAYFTNHLFREYGRFPHSVGDRFLFLFGNVLDEYVFSGPASRCIQVLQDGHLLTISPGGTREAQFATNNYELLWNNRCGYARVAKAAQVPIIPIFTKNCRQTYILPQFLQILLRPLYEWLRKPVVPMVGGFPVKFISYVGEPIRPDQADTPEELAKIAEKAMENLIKTNQTFPATIWNALKERFVDCDKLK